jgi:hypothetical protein
MVKAYADLDTVLLIGEETSQPTVAVDMASQDALDHSRSINSMYTANSQEGGSCNFIRCDLNLKRLEVTVRVI